MENNKNQFTENIYVQTRTRCYLLPNDNFIHKNQRKKMCIDFAEMGMFG